MNLNNKVALVTGASRGIGEAIAILLAKNGAKVIGTATTDANVEIINKNIKEYNGLGKLLKIEEEGSIENLVKEIEKEIGSIDILVNNAGITRDNLLLRMKEDEWNQVFDINLKSIYRASKAVLKSMMKKHAGRIINISSVVGVMGNAGQSNYAATKAGIIGFTKSLAWEIGSRNITVNAIAPGFVKSDMTDNLSEDTKNFLKERIPLKRLGSPEDIANAVLFLASDNASYITGQTIHVNGGMLMP